MDSKISCVIVISVLFLSGCVTAVQQKYSFKSKEETTPFCSSERAMQKYVFLLHSDLSPKSGVDVSTAGPASTARSGNAEWVANNFVKLLLSEYLFDEQPVANPMAEKSGGSTINEKSNVWIVKTPLWEFSQNAFGGSDQTGQRLAWLGAFEFYLWNLDVLGEEPNTVLGKRIEFDTGETCNWFFDHRLTTFTRSCGSIPPSGLFSFAGKTGFNAAEFIDAHYFTASDADKSKLCEKAGLQADCFDFSTDEKIQSMRSALEKGTARQRYAFLAHSKFMGTAYKDIRDKADVKLDWQSALIKDLILQASVKISKKINANVTDYRIEWDPSPFCKYGRPLSDLYTH